MFFILFYVIGNEIIYSFIQSCTIWVYPVPICALKVAVFNQFSSYPDKKFFFHIAMTSLLVNNQRIKKYLPPFLEGKGGGYLPYIILVFSATVSSLGGNSYSKKFLVKYRNF